MTHYPTTPTTSADPHADAQGRLRATKARTLLGATATVALLGLLVGCGPDPNAEPPTYSKVTPPDMVDDPHAGHNHPPGEHPVHEPVATTPAPTTTPLAPDKAQAMVDRPDLPKDATPRDALAWTLPDGWREAENSSSMRLATIMLADDYAECSILILGGDGGKVLWNVNRWRRELNQPALDQAAVDAITKPLPDAAIDESIWVRLDNEGRGTISAFIPLDGRMLFATIKAPSDLLDAEQDRFLAFAASIRPAGQ